MRDRRRGKRVLTIANGLRALLAVVVLFASFSIVTEMRSDDSDGFGRLYSSRVAEKPVAAHSMSVVTEAEPVPDATAADPRLLDAARRAQYLGVEPPVPSLAAAVSPQAEPLTVTPRAGEASAPPAVNTTAPTARPLLRDGDTTRRVVITGGAEGVHLAVRNENETPPLQ